MQYIYLTVDLMCRTMDMDVLVVQFSLATGGADTDALLLQIVERYKVKAPACQVVLCPIKRPPYQILRSGC